MTQASFFYNDNVYVFISFMMSVYFVLVLFSLTVMLVGQEGLGPRHLIVLHQDLTGILISN